VPSRAMTLVGCFLNLYPLYAPPRYLVEEGCRYRWMRESTEDRNELYKRVTRNQFFSTSGPKYRANWDAMGRKTSKYARNTANSREKAWDFTLFRVRK